jgi:phospholipid/cholesterol/gamma-HCH transport system permease protein
MHGNEQLVAGPSNPGDEMPTIPQSVEADEPTEYGPAKTIVDGYVTGSPAVTQPAEPMSAVSEIIDWSKRYIRRHPLQSLDTVGAQVQVGLRTVQYLFIDLATRRFPFREFVQQAAFMAGTALLPTLFVTIPLGVTLSIQFSLLAGQVGATSLAGAATGLFTIRQGASLVSAILLATAVGSAVCADLGSRTMREEIDAMEVMGVSPIRRLVVPRFGAVVLIGVALTGWACFVGFLAGYVYNVYMQDGTPGSFVSTFASFAAPSDYVLAFAKSIVFGAIVAVVSCQKGLSTRGGPAEVANSVNAAVVESILLLMVVNVAMSQLYILIFPRVSL